MRKLSAARPETLRPPHDNTPSPDNPPLPTRQPSTISTTTLRPRQPSATNTATLRDQHDNSPATATPVACVPGNPNYPPAPAANHQSCFPEYWGTFTPAAGADWFNKWAVKSVQVSDPAGGSPGLFTSYVYASPAWHFDDNELVQAKDRTYGQWRGYQDVRTYSGSGDPNTETETTYYQGMSDDNNTTVVNLKDSQNGLHEDLNQLSGETLETTSYDYASTTSTPPADHSEIFSFYVSPAAIT